MRVRSRTGVAVVAAIAMFGAAGAALAATTVNPPAGTPNLAQMALAPADLANSDGIAGSGYITPPQGFSAAYAATLFPSVTSDGVKYASVTSEVAVAPKVSDATEQLAYEYSHYYSRGGRRRFVRAVVKVSPKRGPDHLTAKNFAYSDIGPAGIGDGSYIETLTLHEHHRSQQQVYLVYVTGTYYIYVNLAGTVNEAVPQSDAVALGRTVAAHIVTVLGGAGTTGASGTTGPS
jgi:hypothetical protein